MRSVPPARPPPAWWERDRADSHALTLPHPWWCPVGREVWLGRGGGGGVWARQIQVFIERSYGMTEESHYLLIKYWSRAIQVLTSKLIWADPWDQWLGVCVCVCVHLCLCVCVWLNEKSRKWGERKKGVCLQVWQVARPGEKEIITIQADGERRRLKFETTESQSVERVDCVKEKWRELKC